MVPTCEGVNVCAPAGAMALVVSGVGGSSLPRKRRSRFQRATAAPFGSSGGAAELLEPVHGLVDAALAAEESVEGLAGGVDLVVVAGVGEGGVFLDVVVDPRCEVWVGQVDVPALDERGHGGGAGVLRVLRGDRDHARDG